MKGFSCEWIVGAFDYLQDNKQFAIDGFKETGILDVLQ